MSEHVFLKRPLTSTRGPALRGHFVIRMHQHLHERPKGHLLGKPGNSSLLMTSGSLGFWVLGLGSYCS